MRGLLAFCLIGAGCVTETPNPPVENRPPPRVIAGGGIGDGAIRGVVNLYVIDDATRMPISGAAVRVGAIDGTTDASGLFVADGVTGAQTVIARATGYRSELWVGANGANVTIDLRPAVAPSVARANLSGQISGFGSVTVPSGHDKVATVAYAQTDAPDDPANQLTTFASGNVCVEGDAATSCPYTITARAGQIGLIAAIADRDTKGTLSSDDDTSRVIGWAYRSGITVVDGANQGSVDLTLLDAADASLASVDLGTPPGSLARVQGMIGVETADGVLQLPVARTPADTGSFAVPALAAVDGTAYRLSAVAQTALGDAGNQSLVIVHGATSPMLSVTSWMAPPTGVALSRTSLAWDLAAGAQVTTVEFTQGLLPVTHLLNVAVFDGSTSVAVPDVVALPSGLMSAKLTAIGAAGLDVGNFGLDADRRKIDHAASVPVAIP